MDSDPRSPRRVANGQAEEAIAVLNGIAPEKYAAMDEAVADRLYHALMIAKMRYRTTLQARSPLRRAVQRYIDRNREYLS